MQPDVRGLPTAILTGELIPLENGKADARGDVTFVERAVLSTPFGEKTTIRAKGAMDLIEGSYFLADDTLSRNRLPYFGSPVFGTISTMPGGYFVTISLFPFPFVGINPLSRANSVSGMSGKF